MNYILTTRRETFCAVFRQHAKYAGLKFLITHVEVDRDGWTVRCNVRFEDGTRLDDVPAIECYEAVLPIEEV